MKYLSVCSGMEAASVAWHPLGWTPIGFSEIEKFPCAILAHRFPQTPNYGSLTEYQSWPIEQGAVDLLVGGTPCQSYSVAGKRQGLNDPRGQLMLSFLDLAQRLKVRWLVWENVPGVLSSGQPRGSDFATFLQGLVERGYGWAYRVLDAQYVGGDGYGPVPQRRRRVFVVACLGSWESAAKVLFEPDCLRGDTPKGRKKGQGVATGVEGGAGAEGGCWWDGGQVSQTLDAVLQKGQTMPEKNRFPAVLQPQPIVIDRAAFNQGQNAQFDPHIAESDVMDSLVARGPHAVGVRDEQPTPIQDGRDIDKKQNGLGVGQPGDPAYTLDTTGAQAAAIPFRKSKRAQSTTDDESWVEASESNTLNNFDLGDTRTTHAVIYENHAQDSRVTGPHDVSPTVAAKFGTGGGNVPLAQTPMAVRRLTPEECEALQGFPKGWTRIPWKGKPEDQCPDGPRYKACGNSMAVPVMRWIGERIAAVDSKLSHHA